MFGDMYSQMMKARLGVGKPLEGYGGFTNQPQQPQNGGVVPPWMQGGMWRQQQPHEPRPQGGGYLPMENPWNPRQTGYENRPKDGGIEGGPFGPPHPKPQDPMDSQPSGMGYMGGMKNPWQRY